MSRRTGNKDTYVSRCILLLLVVFHFTKIHEVAPPPFLGAFVMFFFLKFVMARCTGQSGGGITSCCGPCDGSDERSHCQDVQGRGDQPLGWKKST